MKPEQLTLKNGMRVVVVPMAGLASVTVLTMVGVGSRFEVKGKVGISHFLEHLPFKGTQHYPTPLSIATAIDGVGGKHNAFTSKDYTGYWVKVADQHLDLALDVVSDLLLTPRLQAKDIEMERGVILEEIKYHDDDPPWKVSNVFDELVFEGSPLAFDTAGYKHTVSQMTRADFLAHYDGWYDPKNVTVGVVGKISDDRSQMTELLENYFSKGASRKGGGKRTFGLPEQTKPRLKVFYKKTEQAHFHLGYPAIGWENEDRYGLGVLSTVLGGNSSAWLFNEIREKRGLAYYAYAGADMYKETGSLSAFEGVTVGKIDEAIKVTLEQFNKMNDGKVSEMEVDRAKEYLVGKMSLDLEDSSVMANMVVRKLLLENKVETADEVMAKIKKVTREQVVRLAKAIMKPEKLNLAIVGPYKDEAKFEKLI